MPERESPANLLLVPISAINPATEERIRSGLRKLNLPQGTQLRFVVEFTASEQVRGIADALGASYAEVMLSSPDNARRAIPLQLALSPFLVVAMPVTMLREWAASNPRNRRRIDETGTLPALFKDDTLRLLPVG